MNVKCFVCGQGATNCYICYDNVSKNAFCVDVADSLPEAYFRFISSNELNICYLLLTHGHFDHTLAVKEFKKVFPAVPVVISREDYENIQNGEYIFCPPLQFVKPQLFAETAKSLPFNNCEIKVLATPGHSSGSVCYLIEDKCFCGDTVFCGGVGRTDFATGSFTALMKSVKQILALGDYRLFPGHLEQTDIAREKAVNPYFQI